MSGYRNRTLQRVDGTAKALIAYAKSLGFLYAPINGVLDGNLAWGQTVIAVDWKSPGGNLTKAQTKLIAEGFPVRFISKPEQLDALRAEMMR